MTRLVKRAAILQMVTAVLSVGSVVAAVVLLSGCGGLSLDDKYRAKIGMCVEEAKTLAESKACRQLVDAEFGVYDGGVR